MFEFVNIVDWKYNTNEHAIVYIIRVLSEI